MLKHIRISFCFLLLLIILVPDNVLSQSKIIGTINNGGKKQVSSGYSVTGNLGQTSITKNQGSSYKVNTGFWQMYMNKIFLYPEKIQVVHTYTFGDPTKTGNYQMIGIPGINNIPIKNLMTGTPGKEGDWRAFWDPGSGDYTEFSDGSNLFNLTPGRGLWTISKNPVNINLANINTVQLTADYSYSIPLHDQWNIISNPFDKAVAWTDVVSANPGIQPIHFFNNSAYTQPEIFEPYKAYYFMKTGSSNQLKIPYPYEESLIKQNYRNENELRIKLYSGNDEKGLIGIGTSQNSNPGNDEMDVFSPPSYFSENFITIYNSNIETNYKFLQKDFREEIGEGQEYEIFIKHSSDQITRISASGLENYEEYKTLLFDKNLKKFYNLNQQNEIVLRNNNSEKQFVLYIGTEAYIQQKMSAFLPSEFTLFQNYPNPFNPATFIRFSLPQEGEVSLKIFSVLGELVADLIKGQTYDAGFYEVEFNGNSMASGIYIYKLQVRNGSGIVFNQEKKMLLVK
jgi:hypothetical protein